MALERIVVVGASLAGLRAAQTVRCEGFEGTLTVIGDEPHLPYSRPPLSKQILAGATEPESAALLGPDALDAVWLLGRRASRLDRIRRHVVLENGEPVPYDGLVIATGAAPKQLANPAMCSGVHQLRTLDDCLALRESLRRGRPRVAVVGAGFVGSEVASTCRALGLDVTMIDPLPLPLSPIGDWLGEVCMDLYREHGVNLHLGSAVSEFEGAETLEQLRLTDGSVVAADVAVVAVGVAPTTGWLRGAGIKLNDGVICDEALAVAGCERIVAAGDVARWPNRRFDRRMMRLEHWSNAVDQGIAAARTLLADHDDVESFAPVPSFWSDQFGVRIQALGLPRLGDECVLVEGSLADRRFLVLFGAQGRAVGAVAFNMPQAIAAARELIATGRVAVRRQRSQAGRRMTRAEGAARAIA